MLLLLRIKINYIPLKEENMKKRKKSKKSKKFLIRKIVAIIIIIVIILAVKNLRYKFSTKEKTEQTRLLLNNNFVELSSNIYVENSIIYVSEEDIEKIFDNTIYYNVGDKELITSYNKHVAVMHLNKNEMIVNDSVLQTQGQLKAIDSKIYLPLTDLQIVYDIEAEYSESTNMVIIDSTTKSKRQVIVLDDAKVKLSKNLFSVTVEKVKRGDYLYVIEDDGKYKKVRTSSRKYWIYKK